MTSYLLVALASGGTLLEVGATEQGILAKLLLDEEGNLLHATFALQAFFLFVLLTLEGFVVGEKVELIVGGSRGDTVFGHHMVGADGDAAHEQLWVDQPAVEVVDGIDDTT